MYFIVGLGNPGDEYVGTRHNVGRDFLFDFAESENFSDWSKSKGAKAFYSKGSLKESSVELLVPETFMNKSGETVLYAVKKHEAKPENIIVVYDDVDLPVGEIKISYGRGSGGHNGVESIIKAIGSKDFVRVRIGVATKGFFGTVKRPPSDKMAKHVLGKFSKKEISKLEEAKEMAKSAINKIILEGVNNAMNQFN